MGHLVVLNILAHYETLLIATFNFSSKIKTKNTIILPENHKIIKENKTISHTFNKYLPNFTKTLKLKNKPLKKKPLKHQLKHFKNQYMKKIQKHLNDKVKFTFH